jgi:hypothetical protein
MMIKKSLSYKGMIVYIESMTVKIRMTISRIRCKMCTDTSDHDHGTVRHSQALHWRGLTLGTRNEGNVKQLVVHTNVHIKFPYFI